MRQRLLAFVPALMALGASGAARADSTVPALTPATSLVGSTTYLAQGGALDRALAFNTTMFGVTSNALVLNTTTLGSTALSIGGTTSTIAGLTLTSPTINAGALSGTFSGTPTYSGVPTYSGLSAGTQVSCLGLDSGNHVVLLASACGAGGGSGTVTSVALSVPGTSIFGVSGSPVTTSGTLGLTTTGTSGGIPYFSSTSALSTSAALTANLPVIGGGAGAAPSVGTRSGNTTAYVTTTGTQTSGDCVKIDASGNHIANGSACGSGGTSTVTANGNTETAVTTFAFGPGFSVPGGSSGSAAITQIVTLVTDATASRTLTGTDGGKVVHMTNGAATTITLPDSAIVTSKFGTNLICDAGCTVNRAGSDTVNGGTSFVVAPKAWASIATDGAGVFLLGLGPGAVTGTGSMVQATSPTLVTPTIGVATATSVNKVAVTAPATSATLAIADGKTLTDTSGTGAVALKGATGGGFGQAACADLSNGSTGCSLTLGTGVGTAAAASLSAAGGLTTTIASGTSALGTSAISSAACATVVTTAATNTATTDVVLASFNGDPTAVTGYVPLTAGMLTIVSYPTSGNVNFKVCNNTTSSITPGAITLNWRVVR